MAGTTSVTTSASSKKTRGKHTSTPKPKMTKEERRAKYTQLAREREAKKRRKLQSSNLVCYQCRQRGHAVADCPKNNNNNVAAASNNADDITKSKKKAKKDTAAAQQQSSNIRVCFKCGSTEHSLSVCPKRNKEDAYDDDDLPYCHCFICHETGHLSSKCPQNTHGIFVNGGACKTCGSKLHTGKDCPERRGRDEELAKQQKKEQALMGPEVDTDTLLAGKGDDLAGMTVHETTTTKQQSKEENENDNKKKKKKPRVVNF